MCTPLRSQEELKAILNEMRIELMDRKVPSNRVMKGRIFFDLNSEITIDSIEVDFKRTLAFTQTDGRVILLCGDGGSMSRRLKLLPVRRPKLAIPGFNDDEVKSHSIRPPLNDCALVETIPSKVMLRAGTSAIPFLLYLPKSMVPSFTYISLKGTTVLNSYSIEAIVRMRGVTKRTGRVGIHVPAMGKRDVVAKFQTGLNSELIVTNQQFSDENGFGYSLNFSQPKGERERPKQITTQVYREFNCPALGLREIRPIGEEHMVKFHKENTNPVIEEYMQNPSSAPLTTPCDYCAYESDFKVKSTIPTVNTTHFTCNYYLQVDCEGRTYRASIIKVDDYDNNQ